MSPSLWTASPGAGAAPVGRRVSDRCRLWVFTSRAVKQQANRLGLIREIAVAGGVVLYLPAFMDIQAWFSSTADCLDAAVNGKWSGRAP